MKVIKTRPVMKGKRMIYHLYFNGAWMTIKQFSETDEAKALNLTPSNILARIKKEKVLTYDILFRPK